MAADYDRLACRNDGYDEQWLMADGYKTSRHAVWN